MNLWHDARIYAWVTNMNWEWTVSVRQTKNVDKKRLPDLEICSRPGCSTTGSITQVLYQYEWVGQQQHLANNKYAWPLSFWIIKIYSMCTNISLCVSNCHSPNKWQIFLILYHRMEKRFKQNHFHVSLGSIFYRKDLKIWPAKQILFYRWQKPSQLSSISNGHCHYYIYFLNRIIHAMVVTLMHSLIRE